MLNQSAEYALRATLLMAHRGADHAHKANAIAEALGIPAEYLGKIMHMLVKAKVLKSVRGPMGGYSLAVAPAQLRLEHVIAPFQELNPSGVCLMGDRHCDRSQPCAAHQRWGRMKDEFMFFIQNTTLADLLTPLPELEPNSVQLTEVA